MSNWTWKKFPRSPTWDWKNFENMQSRHLTFEGKIDIFKALASSKREFLAQVLPVAKTILENIQCIQKDLWIQVL